MKNKRYEEEWQVVELGEMENLSNEDEEPVYWTNPYIKVYIRKGNQSTDVYADKFIEIEPDLIFTEKEDIDSFISLLEKAKKYLD